MMMGMKQPNHKNNLYAKVDSKRVFVFYVGDVIGTFITSVIGLK